MKKVSDIKIDIPKYPKEIIETLESNGYQAYLVGGCVRDSILGVEAFDYDITTDAAPSEIKKIFKRTIDTGIAHGTVSVLFYDEGKPLTYEVTTFRIDGEYKDGRHPEDVIFVNDLKDDLLRRDFTANAMAYNEITGLIDLFGGLHDLDKKIIRAVGDPIERFTEDALRLMRAVRFSAKLGFSIEEDTKNAIIKLASNLSKVSKERVNVELTKTLTSNNPTNVKLYFDFGLSKYIAKGFDKIESGKIDPNLSIHLAYACFFYNTDTNNAVRILKELKFDNSNINKISLLLKGRRIYKNIKKYYDNKNIEKFELEIKDLIFNLKYDLVYDFITLLLINESDVKFIKKILSTIYDYQRTFTPIFLSDLNITGNDLLQIGFKGEEIGISLNALLKIVHKNKEYNDKDKLISLAKKAYDRISGGIYELQ